MSEWSGWIVAIVINKYLLYLSIAASVGSVFMLTQTQVGSLSAFSRRYGVYASLLGLILAPVDLLLQVGLFADAGVAGLVDSSYIAMLWDSPLGQQLVWRALGFLVLLVVFSWVWGQQKALHWRQGLFALPALFLLCLACLQAGHTVEQVSWVHWVLAVHFLLGLGWMGCLWPLALSCRQLDVLGLQQLMQQFGRLASFCVPILLIAGVALAYALTGSFSGLFTSTHGQLLLAKVTLVAGLMGFSAYHKLKLVPELTESHKPQRLGRSIYREMGLGLVVLGLTAVLSTVVGPAVLINQ